VPASRLALSAEARALVTLFLSNIHCRFQKTSLSRSSDSSHNLISFEEKCEADQAGKLVVTSFVSAEASATDETEDRRLRDMEAEVLRLRLGRVEFRPETGGELPRVKLGREGEPGRDVEVTSAWL